MKKALLILLLLCLISFNGVYASNNSSETIMFRGFFGSKNEVPKFSVSKLESQFDDLGDIELPPYVYEPDSYWNGTTGATLDVLEAKNGLFLEINRYTLGENNILIRDEKYSPLVKGTVKIQYPDPSGELNTYDQPKKIWDEIDASQMDKYDVNFFYPTLETSYTFEEPGYYFISFRYEGLGGGAFTMLKLEGETETNVTEEIKPVDPVEAIPTNSNIYVNGEKQNFEAYLINDQNYFKLRDIAMAVNETEKNFNVTWDGKNRVINLISNALYKPVGGELALGDGLSKKGLKTQAKIYKDNSPIDLLGYNINDNNFFKLRDIAQSFNIGITWNNETKSVGINTNINYTD